MRPRDREDRRRVLWLLWRNVIRPRADARTLIAVAHRPECPPAGPCSCTPRVIVVTREPTRRPTLWDFACPRCHATLGAPCTGRPRRQQPTDDFGAPRPDGRWEWPEPYQWTHAPRLDRLIRAMHAGRRVALPMDPLSREERLFVPRARLQWWAA